MTKYIEIQVKSALSRSGLPDLDYSLNPYIGCFHGCLYCYARSYTKLEEVSEKWGEVIYIKANLVEVLERETRKLRPGVVGISTVTDPYQPIESIKNLVRKSIELLLRRGFRISIQTKSDLVLRDLDILSHNRDSVDVGFTIITLDANAASILEPRAPQPKQRAEALIKIAEEGIRTWLFYGPVIPSINDDSTSIREVLEEVGPYVNLVLVDKLRITQEVYESLSRVLENVDRVVSLSRSMSWWYKVTKELAEVCERMKVRCVPSLAEPVVNKNKSLVDFSYK